MRRIVPCLLLGLLPLVALACPSAGPAEKRLIYGRGGDSVKLDPADISDGESVKVVNQIFETLVTYAEETPDLVPGLATSWESSDDGRTWTFQLREGVTFHDGAALDAEAVVFTFERILDPDHPHRHATGGYPYAQNYANIREVEAVDGTTVRFHLEEPSAVFLPNLAMFPACVVSPDAVREHGEAFGQNPVGTGPFVFEQWRRNDRIVLERNPDYWGEAPSLDEVVFAVVPENAARVERLDRGELHLIDGVNLSDVEHIEEADDLRLLSVPGMNFGYLAMNNDDAPFDDPDVRRAVAHAVDREALIDLAFYGRARPGVNPIPPTVWGYHDGIEARPHDPERARELLGGREFEVTLHAMPNPRPYMPEPLQVAQAIQEDLRAVGIRVEIVSPTWSTYLEEVQNGRHDLALLGWTTDNGDPDNFLHELLSSDTAVPGQANNISFYRNDDVDRLLEEAQRTLDVEERERRYRRAQEIIHEDVPMLPLVYLDNIAASRDVVTGYRLHPVGIVRLAPVSLAE